jgi:aspartyl-tRNA(Asn)/glutamyl-tRNA(Gln) amidotransferase subunit A
MASDRSMQSYSTLRPRLLQRQTTCVQVVTDALAAADAAAPCNAFLEVFGDALERAAEVDKRIQAGTAGVLAGAIVAVKDNISIEGKTSGCASRILDGYRAQYNATVIQRLLDADAILIGRTNMDEFAMGSSSENTPYGAVRNPFDLERVAGGSSGGSAVAVATGVAHMALGSDTGGSVRQPAAFTGVLGLKPTYGRLSRSGLVAFASSLDVIGCFARSTDDAALIYASMAGYDAADATSAMEPVDDPLPHLGDGVHGLRIGIPAEYLHDAIDPAITGALDAAADAFRAGGAELRSVALPHTKYSIPVYAILAMAEASSNLARYDGVRYGRRAGGGGHTASRSAGFGPEVKRRIMLGTYALSAGYYDAYYRKAQQVRRLIHDDFLAAFADVDLLLTPTTPSPAFRLGEKAGDPLQMYLSDIFTAPANLAGVPALNVPAGKTQDGLPLGVQLMAPHFGESALLTAAACLERARA